MKKLKSMSIFMPMFNEESNAERAIISAVKFLKSAAEDYELILVNDASTDSTKFILDRWVRVDNRIKVIHLPVNTRYAGAFKAGLYAAAKDIIFYTDGDNPIDFEDVRHAISLLDEADVVIGYRIQRREGFRRDVYTIGYRFFLRHLFGMRFRDTNFAFKLMKHKTIRGIRLFSRGLFIDAELLYRIKERGFKIVEISAKYYPRVCGVSTLANIKAILKILWEAVGFWAKRVRRGYF